MNDDDSLKAPTLTSDQILQAQYNMLRDEIISLVDQMRKMEILAVGAIAVFFGWAASLDNPPPAIWYVPLCLVPICALRHYALAQHIGAVAVYLIKIEARWGGRCGDDLPGWQRHYEANSKTRDLMCRVDNLFWSGLAVLTLCVGLAFQLIPRKEANHSPLKVQIVDAKP